MKKKRFISTLALGLAMSCFFVGCGADAEDKGKDSSSSSSGQVQEVDLLGLNKYEGATLDFAAEGYRKYQDATDAKIQARILKTASGQIYDKQSVTFSWEGDGSAQYTVYFSESKNFTAAYEKTVTGTSTSIGYLTPGKTYYWKVKSGNGVTSAVDSFVVEDTPGLFVTVSDDTEGTLNMRDIGGWKTLDGKTVKYGMLYRGGELNALTETGKKTFREDLKVKTEIDFRTAGQDDKGQTECAFSADATYIKASFTGYTYILPGFSYKDASSIQRGYDERTPQALKTIFSTLSDESSYPVYFHCIAGADRTGTLAFLINGLLGVSYEDLVRDFEATSFSVYGNRWRSDIDGLNYSEYHFNDSGIACQNSSNWVAFGLLYKEMMARYGEEGGTLSAAIENYLTIECGVTVEEITALKDIMLY